ncbi:MAG: hypothetical protein HDR18_08370 [Lachnospiraceae bacterium]|nr:hypothetical protein [Lachnospiraceae bacterium]
MDDLELEVTEPAPEDAVPADDGAGDTVPTDEKESSGSDETLEADPEESGPEETPEEAEPSDETETPGSENQPEDSESEDLTGEPADDAGETVSGNDIVTISGNAVIFPEDFDLSLLGSGNGSNVDQTALIEAIENQSTLLYNVSAAVIFLLGVIAGILLIHGFRLRRT